MSFTYRPEVYRAAEMPDIKGFDVEARDGHIGKIDEATFEPDSSSLVVDTGHWIFGKRRMIPAGVVESIVPAEKKVYVALTKGQVKGGPDYDEVLHAEDQAAYHRDVGMYYDPLITPML